MSDTGCGIPDKDLPRLTERFYRVDKARSRELGGTGLGLAIVKHIAQAHDGELKIQSQAGERAPRYPSICTGPIGPLALPLFHDAAVESDRRGLRHLPPAHAYPRAHSANLFANS